MVRLEEVNAENINDMRYLSIDDNQKKFLMEGPLFFIAESKFYPNRIPMAIYGDGRIVGFFRYGLSEDEDNKCYIIGGLMIDKRYQKKGYGKKALEIIINEIKKDKARNKIGLSVIEDNTVAIKLYKSLGFEVNDFSRFVIDEDTGICNHYISMTLLY